MGNGRNGPSHCPLPKVLLWSEDDPLKSNKSQLNEEYLPVVALPGNIPFESQNANMKTNFRVSLKPKHKDSPPQVISPQELQTADMELLISYSDPLAGATELQLVEQLMVSYENNKVWMSADSIVELYNCIKTLVEYNEYKYNPLNDPAFA